MDPYAFAISSHIVAKVKFLDLASFGAAQTIEICSQQPGTFFIQPFCTDLLMNLLLFIKGVSRFLETKLKKILPYIFSSGIGTKSEMLCSVGGLTFITKEVLQKSKSLSCCISEKKSLQSLS